MATRNPSAQHGFREHRKWLVMIPGSCSLLHGCWNPGGVSSRDGTCPSRTSPAFRLQPGRRPPLHRRRLQLTGAQCGRRVLTLGRELGPLQRFFRERRCHHTEQLSSHQADECERCSVPSKGTASTCAECAGIPRFTQCPWCTKCEVNNHFNMGLVTV